MYYIFCYCHSFVNLYFLQIYLRTKEKWLTNLLQGLHYFCNFLHQRSSRSSTTPSLGFSKGLFVQISAFFSICQLSLSLAEFGQVEGSNFFSLLNLLLVCLDL